MLAECPTPADPAAEPERLPRIAYSFLPRDGEIGDVDYIYLADDEWGQDVMRHVAAEWFALVEDCQFVLIYEHAGWYLGFRRDMSIWATANDTAILSQPKPQPDGRPRANIRR